MQMILIGVCMRTRKKLGGGGRVDQNLPKISVITPVYNGEHFLERTILSVINCNYPKLEYIIVDGNSTDGTIDIIKKYRKYFSVIISEPDKGMYDALNKGFSKATGDILCWLNSDDEYYPHTLSSVAKIFTDLPNVEWITGGNSHINECGTIFSYGKARRIDKIDFVMGDYKWIQQESTFWRSSLLKKLQHEPFNLSIKYAGDFALWFEFFQHSSLYFTDILLGKFRHTNGQLSQTFISEYVQEVQTVIDNYEKTKEDEKLIKKRMFCKKMENFISKLKLFNSQIFINKMFQKTIRRYEDKEIKYLQNENSFVL